MGFGRLRRSPENLFSRKPVGSTCALSYPVELRTDDFNFCRYVIRVLQWCRKYGLRVNLVLNAVPGSQNGEFNAVRVFCQRIPDLMTRTLLGFNHGGKSGSHNFLGGVMGMANAQRTLYYIRVLTEFISQPEWVNVVPMLSILNQPLPTWIGVDQLRSL